MNYRRTLMAFGLAALFFADRAFATNPLITDQFSADPTARVFEGRVYVYSSHDIPYSPGRGRTNWFIMEDYHVFSSENLNDWTDHGMILNQTNVPWLNRQSFDMWAPDCVFKNGKYYFYFPTGGRIGVAIADKPYGPFQPEQKPIDGANGIDPCVLIDKDGSAYLFWARGRISVAKLKDNMVELDSTPMVITNLPTKGLIEGPFAFERNGIYYLTYPHANTTTERLEYSTSTNPMGPYEPKGVILDEAADGCWTVHQSMVEYKGQWYLFYHDKDLSPDFDKNRSIGWKISLKGSNTWVQFNKVDFGKDGLKSVNVRASAPEGGSVEIHLDKADGPLLAKATIGKNSEWQTVKAKLEQIPSGIHDLMVTHNEKQNVDLDWISFE